ncbi:MAG: hypothetical protein Kilf2KO_06770 [Rhodospirillales bacterium]
MTAYIIAQIEVTDPDAYSLYTAQTPGVVAAHGGTFIVRGGDPEVLEGSLPGSRIVVIAFADRAAAQGFYNSDAYQEILPLRLAAATGAACIVDGVA